ncbi:MAG: hypothetical protein IPL53_23820 [Ignavibacteria bacterium]|nr:hypothetical protein [Ignavibacteria bacterium]
MEVNNGQQNNSHFPEDRDAPVIDQKRSFFRDFYERHKNPVDYLVFLFISVMTLVSVSLSIYIVAVKYF